MKLERFGEREHGVGDVTVLLAMVFLCVTTWSYVSDTAGVPVWKLYTGVAITWFLALAALTRHRQWSVSIRLLTGVWMIAAPHLLGFSQIGPAHWSYLAVGLIVTAMAIAGVAQIGLSRVDWRLERPVPTSNE